MAGANDHHIDSLYQLPPEEFVAARDALARELRQAGNKDSATAVTALRRPTVAAWALNQLRQRDPDGVEELSAVGDSLRDAQERALAGDPDADLRAAAAARRVLVVRLTKAASDALRDAGREPGQHVDAIASVLERSVVSDDVQQLLRTGRVTSERDAAAGDAGDDVAALFAASVTRPRAATPSTRAKATAKGGRPTPPARAAKPAPDRATRARQRRALESARASADAADQDLEAAESEADKAARAVATVTRRVERLEHQLREARLELDAGRGLAKEAKAAVTSARRRQNEAQRAVRRLLDADDAGAGS